MLASVKYPCNLLSTDVSYSNNIIGVCVCVCVCVCVLKSAKKQHHHPTHKHNKYHGCCGSRVPTVFKSVENRNIVFRGTKLESLVFPLVASN
jgi:hypothetical protein